MTHTLIETEQRKTGRIACTRLLGKCEAKANFEQIKSIKSRCTLCAIQYANGVLSPNQNCYRKKNAKIKLRYKKTLNKARKKKALLENVTERENQRI